MIATLLKTVEKKSKFGGTFFYAFFKTSEGKSCRACLYPNFGNFKRWQPFINREKVVLNGLAIKGNLVDADSFPKEIV